MECDVLNSQTADNPSKFLSRCTKNIQFSYRSTLYTLYELWQGIPIRGIEGSEVPNGTLRGIPLENSQHFDPR